MAGLVWNVPVHNSEKCTKLLRWKVHEKCTKFFEGAPTEKCTKFEA